MGIEESKNGRVNDRGVTVQINYFSDEKLSLRISK